jgi:hypothetical protein
MADLAQGDDRAGRDGLRPVHVGVDDVRPDLGQVGRQGPDRDGVIRFIDDQDGEAGPLELAHGAARREGDDRHVVAAGVHPRDQSEEMFLGAAVGAGREDLDDPDAAAAAQHRAADGVEAGIERAGSAHHPSLRRTSTRWMGSSTAPHSYLYDSSPRRKSIRRRPRSRARTT